ncbi:MAG: GxxExxY protein [Candidatus Hydrogenedens sp.]|jgi:GxxExxY protein|nr:GxxExxY protein [Candidatus Hydrogenedens sp.]
MSLLYKEESYLLRGAIYEVYQELGHGYVEMVYQSCLEQELATRDIPFHTQKRYPLRYKGILLKHEFVPDLLCFDKILVELKAVKVLTAEHRAQVMNYLKVTELKLGLLVNFGHYPGVEIERIVL